MLLSGCAPAPIPSPANTVYGLKAAKLDAERIAGCVKLLKKPKAKELYSDARTAYNATISQIIVALRNGSDNRQSIENNLADAQHKYDALVSWYEKGRQRGEFGKCGSMTSNAIDVAQLIVDIAKMIQDHENAKINDLINELRRCEWKEWKDVK
jgi:hypothetical protein